MKLFIVLCFARYLYFTYFCDINLKIDDYECRQCKIANAQGNAGILHFIVAGKAVGLHVGHHSAAQGGRTAGGRGNVVPAAYATEKRPFAELQMAGKYAGASAKILYAHRQRGGFPPRIGQGVG